MSGYFIVPWYNSREWHKLYTDIYSPNSTNLTKEEALKLFRIWKARSPALPSGMESTLTLLEVHVEDSKNLDKLNDEIIRLAYSTALMRFVNHMLDSQTEKGSSLYRAAQNMGVPDWIVDLRHDTAHSNILPSIELLREATSISLDWLKYNYWDKHREFIKDYVCSPKTLEGNEDHKVTALMNFCFSLSICAHSKLNIKTLADIPNLSMRDSIANDIQDLFEENLDLSNLKKISIRSVINQMNIYSKRLLKSKNTSYHVNKALLGKNSLFLSPELVSFLSDGKSRKVTCLSKHYIHCFEVLLTFLHTNDLLQGFILELIKITESSNENNHRRKLAALWTSEILKALKKSSQFVNKMKKNPSTDIEGKKMRELQSLFYHWFPNEKGCSLLLNLFKKVPEDLTDLNFVKPIISTYNVYLSYFIRDLLNLIEPPLASAAMDKICSLATMIASPAKSLPIPSKVYTVADVRAATEECYVINDEELEESEVKDIESDSIAVQQSKQIICGIWKIVSSNQDWSKYPIGVVPLIENSDMQEQAVTSQNNQPMDIDVIQIN